MKLKLICMAFDGAYQVERPVFEDYRAAADYTDDLGRFLNGFYFMTNESAGTIVATPQDLEFLEGRRVKTVARLFKETSQLPECKEVTIEKFIQIFVDNYKGEIQSRT
jgi:hypothetical protein